MNWKMVRQDIYYQARELENKARQGNEGKLWEEYAELKMNKASYLLGIYGYKNAISIYQMNNEVKKVIELYNKAIDIAKRANYMVLVVMIGYELVQVYERLKEWSACIDCYEEVGKFCEQRALSGENGYFYAADAYEHAAEIMSRAGRDISEYTKPIDVWKKNAEYWKERGESEDAKWSLGRIELYKRLFEFKGEDK